MTKDMKKARKIEARVKGLKETIFILKSQSNVTRQSCHSQKTSFLTLRKEKLNLYTKKPSIFIPSSEIQIGHEIHFTQAVGKSEFEMSSCNSYE